MSGYAAKIEALIAERDMWKDESSVANKLLIDARKQRDELLKALKLVDERFGPSRDMYIFSKRNALDKVKAAIAKAEA
jgi:thermostable 8-oxoguanine DNA glycosylase